MLIEIQMKAMGQGWQGWYFPLEKLRGIYPGNSIDKLMLVTSVD